jgi:hypothetical protein
MTDDPLEIQVDNNRAPTTGAVELEFGCERGHASLLADPDGEDAVNEETPGCPQQAGLTLFFVLPLGGWADARRRPERFTIVIHRQSLDVQGEMAT